MCHQCSGKRPKFIDGRVVVPVWVNFRSQTSAENILLEALGFDLKKIRGKRVVKGSMLADENKHFLAILDDVHTKFGEVDFWMTLIKDPMGLPKNVSFVFCATRSKGMADCPVDLSILPTFYRESFLLDPTEAVQFLEMSADKLSSVPLGVILRDSEVQTVMVNECGGHVGSLAMSVNALNSRFRNVNEFDAGDVLRYFMSKQIMDELYRCFPVDLYALPPVVHNLVVRVMRDGWANSSEFTHLLSAPLEVASEDKMIFQMLLNGGILAMTADGKVRFCSPLARRFMTSPAFPNRAEKTLPADITAFELVRLTLSELSANEIAQCVKPGDDFSAEPSWNRLFNMALLSATPPDIQVCSEIAASFLTDSADKDHHRADYWISDKQVNIGLELQHNKSTNDTNKASFGPDGKYRKLKVRDWAMVELHELIENDTGDKIPRCADKVLVLLRKGEFHRCQAVFGDSKEVEEITLKP